MVQLWRILENDRYKAQNWNNQTNTFNQLETCISVKFWYQEVPTLGPEKISNCISQAVLKKVKKANFILEAISDCGLCIWGTLLVHQKFKNDIKIFSIVSPILRTSQTKTFGRVYAYWGCYQV